MSLHIAPTHIVGIGASAGGLAALEEFFKAMPADSGMAFVLVQHLSPDFKSLMDEQLARHTKMAIHRVENEMELEANSIYLIPPRQAMTVADGRLYLRENVSHQLVLPVDIFFESLASAAQNQAIGIVLSGTGSDGSRGIQAIHEAGGLVLVQSVESAQFDGMPRAAINTGMYDYITTPADMPTLLLDYVRDPQEELHSLNEELYTINAEYEKKNAELQALNADHDRLLESLEVGVVFLDGQRRIRKFNSASALAFKLLPQDVGRPIEHIAYQLNDSADGGILTHVQEVLETGETREREVQTHDGKWLLKRIYPFFDANKDVSGVILTFTDITRIKADETRLRALFELLPVGVAILDQDRRVVQANPTLEQVTALSTEALTRGVFAKRRYIRADGSDMPQSEFASARVFETREPIYNVETGILKEDGSLTWTNVSAAPLPDGGVVVVTADITERKQAEGELKRWADIFQNVAFGFVVGSPEDGNFGIMNPAFAEMHGYSMEELVGTPIADVFAPESRAELPEHMRLTHEKGRHAWEARHLRKDGTVFPTLIDAVAVKDEAGKVLYRIVSVQDITERKQAESANAFQASLLDQVHNAIIVIDYDNTIVYWNKHAQELYQYTREEALGKNIVDLLSPAEMKQVVERNFADLNRDGHWEGEFDVKRKDGSTIPAHITNTYWKDSQGKNIGFIGISEDITQRRQAEEKMRIALTKYQILFDTFPLGVTVTDEVGNIIETNRIAEELLGISEEQQRQRQIDGAEWSIIRPDGTPMPADEYASVRALKEGHKVENMEMGILKPDGDITWINVTAAPLGVEGYGVVITYGDITERKQMEAELRESEELFRTFFENAIEAILITKPDGSILKANPAACRMFKRTEQEFIEGRRENVVDLTDPRLAVLLGTRRATGKMQGELTLVRGDGTKFDGEVTSAIYLDKNGAEKTGMTVRDVTERKAIQHQLRESERNYRELVQNANSAIIRWKSDGTIAFFNEFAQLFFGYRPEEVIGQPIGMLVPPTDSTGDDLSTLVQNIVDHPEQYVNVVNENICKDGRRVWMAWTNKPAYDENGQVREILAVGSDITERKRMEEELRRSNAELEQFAYISSHDLQEPLRTVTGMVGLLQQRYQGQLDEHANEYIGHAVDASNRMQQLINDLLDFSRVDTKGRPLKATPMETVLQAALSNLHTAIAESGASVTHGPLPTVQADAGQLTQVLQNLISNSVKFRGKEPPEIHISAERVEDDWQFAVRDNGIGIEPQYFERVFLIFQRLHTRSKYPGTGIGLALCKKIIERHGGKMWIQSELHHGATFYFTIPERSQA